MKTTKELEQTIREIDKVLERPKTECAMIQRPTPLILLVVLFAASSHADEFAKVKCGSNVSQAVIGKSTSPRKLREVENAHRAIGLRNLGSDGLPDDPFQLVWWEICGREYVFLKQSTHSQRVIRDVLPIPQALQGYPWSLPGAECERDNKKLNENILHRYSSNHHTAKTNS